MTNVFFQPYVGEDYHTGYSGKKLMILGESHHCNKIENTTTSCGKAEECLQLPECRNDTNNVINIFLDYKQGVGKGARWMRTYTRFTNVFLGGQASKEELLDFWGSIMFYNYVQAAMEGPRISPTEQDFEQSQTAFFEVLEEYKPDLIIVWGARLEKNLPQKNKSLSDFEIFDTSGHRFHYYEIGGKKIPAYTVYHPSCRYFTYQYHKYLQEAVRLARVDYH